jgi:hypothetical protein
MIEAMKQALAALEEYQEKGTPFMSCDSAVNVLRQAIAEAEKQPDWKALVLNHNADCESRCDMDKCGYKPYFEYSKRRCPDCPTHEMIDVEYTAPQPQREWVGLTDEEIAKVCGFGQFTSYSTQSTLSAVAKAIEAKLKEKNT